jgi:ATP-dependent RNA helicase DDX18/HAS1
VPCSAATNNQTGEGVAIKKVTNVFSKKILAKRALREIKLLQHFRGKSGMHPLAVALLTPARPPQRKNYPAQPVTRLARC